MNVKTRDSTRLKIKTATVATPKMQKPPHKKGQMQITDLIVSEGQGGLKSLPTTIRAR